MRVEAEKKAEMFPEEEAKGLRSNQLTHYQQLSHGDELLLGATEDCEELQLLKKERPLR